ncbi:MAG: hypothetical protein ABDH66_03715 [Bacteroidia bacterium]
MSTWRSWIRTLLSPIKSKETTQTESSKSSIDTEKPTAPPTSSEELDPSKLYPILPLKEWIIRNISPYAWDRTVIRSLPELSRMGIATTMVLAPKPDTELPLPVLQVLLSSLESMYGVKPDLREILRKTVTV